MGWRAFRQAAQARKSKDAILQQNPPTLKSSYKGRARLNSQEFLVDFISTTRECIIEL